MTEAEIWCHLNSGGWLDELGERPVDHAASHIIAIKRMDKALHSIGMKECLREWNKAYMSNEEFEKWWEINGRAVG